MLLFVIDINGYVEVLDFGERRFNKWMNDVDEFCGCYNLVCVSCGGCWY